MADPIGPKSSRVGGRRFRVAVLAALFVSLAAVAAPPAFAATPPRSKQDSADIARIEKYLNNLRTMRARFLQSTQDGATAEGTVYLARPGKLRIEYDPPTPVLIVSDGTLVHYYDSELGQVSTVRLSETPAAVLVRDNYDLSGDDSVTKFERGRSVLRITLRDTRHPDAGLLTLTFQDQPLALKQWKVVDQQGVETIVALSDSRRDVTLAPTLFEFTDPTRRPAPFGN
ncbi:MAG: outer membrane lipoprotein carrier protein LolA [Alphaproteobacteria bacterium]